MHNVLAAAAASVVVVLSTFAALAGGQRTVAATQAAAAAPKVLLAQATEQGDPAARPSRGPQSETTVGDKSAPASPDQATTSANQPSAEQKEKVQKLGQELK